MISKIIYKNYNQNQNFIMQGKKEEENKENNSSLVNAGVVGVIGSLIGLGIGYLFFKVLSSYICLTNLKN